MKRTWAVAILLIGGWAPSGWAERFVSYSGVQLTGSWVKADSGIVSAMIGGSLTAIPVDELSVVEIASKSASLLTSKDTVGAAVHMKNGDVLVGQLHFYSGKELSMTFQKDQVLSFPKSAILAVRFFTGQSGDPTLPALDKKYESDVVKMESNTVSGMVLTMSADNVVFNTPVGEAPPVRILQEGKLKVQAVYLAPFGTDPKSLSGCRIKCVDGYSTVQGELLSADDQAVTVKTPYAGSLKVKMAAIAEIWFLGGKAVYLSDLVPLKVAEESPWGSPEDPWVIIWRYKNDLNCRKMSMLLGGQVYKRGVGVHAKSELTYGVPQGFAHFECVVGIDDRVGRKAKEQEGFARGEVRILVDGALVFQRKIVGGEPPVSVKVPVGGKQTLTLIADYGDKVKVTPRDGAAAKEQEISLDLGDWVNYGDARFSK